MDSSSFRLLIFVVSGYVLRFEETVFSFEVVCYLEIIEECSISCRSEYKVGGRVGGSQREGSSLCVLLTRKRSELNPYVLSEKTLLYGSNSL